MERQQFFVLNASLLQSELVVVIYIRWIECLLGQKRMLHSPCQILKITVNIATMIVGFKSWVIVVVNDPRHP
jgi:hypothetical protein